MAPQMRDAVINFDMTIENRRRIAIELQQRALVLLSEDIDEFYSDNDPYRIEAEIDGVMKLWILTGNSSTSIMFLSRSLEPDSEADDYESSQTILIIHEFDQPSRYWALQKVVEHTVYTPDSDVAVLTLMKEYVDSLQNQPLS